MFDPHSTEFQAALIAAYQGMLQRHSLTGEIEPTVILAHLGSGLDGPVHRSMNLDAWEESRAEARNASWVPVACIGADGEVSRP